MEGRVVLPQPEGPEMETYSPRRISRCTSESAWVSTSSVWNTLRMLARAMTLVVGLMWCAFDVRFPSPLGRRWPGGPDEGARQSDASGSARTLSPAPPPAGEGFCFDAHFSLMRSYLSHWLVSDRMTLSPAFRPRNTCTRSTEAAPM